MLCKQVATEFTALSAAYVKSTGFWGAAAVAVGFSQVKARQRAKAKTGRTLRFMNRLMIPLQKVAFKLDISASSGGNPESAG